MSNVAGRGGLSNPLHVAPKTPVYMLGHIGGVVDKKTGEVDILDEDASQTKEQKKLIDNNNNLLYKRVQHDVRYDIPNRGIDVIQQINPLGMSMLSNHSDKGFDYRDFPLEITKDKEEYDPYIGYLHEKGLIGKNKSKYNVKYLNVDSTYRNKKSISTVSFSVRLDKDPLQFNGQFLRIYMDDTTRFNLNDKISINSISEKQITLRSIVTDDYGNRVNFFQMQNGKQYMTVSADNNMNINSSLTTQIKENYTDMTVSFDGFAGDKRTDWYFDTKNYIWNFTAITLPNGGPGYEFTLTENVHAVTAASAGLPEDDQIREDMVIAKIILNPYGTVLSIDGGYPFDVSNLRWTAPPGSVGGTAPISVPSNFNDLVEEKLNEIPVNIPTLPTNMYTAMLYIQQVQNVARPILLNLMNDPALINFQLRYQEAGGTYIDTVRIAVPEQTKMSTSTQIGNISLNLLNTSHRMYLTSADIERELGIYDPSTSTATDVPSPNKFYIELNKPYQQREFIYTNPLSSGALLFSVFVEEKSDVTITYHHYGGISIKNLNADFPIGFTSTVGFRYVSEITDNYISVELDKIGLFDARFGGIYINIGLIDDITAGYARPNSYVVNLEKVYTNVVMVKMVNSIFPITQKTFIDGSAGGTKNNTFYWQNIDDGDVIYKIEIEPGNYSATELKHTFESLVHQVFRVNDKTVTHVRNYITLDIDEKTDKVVFSAYDEYIANASLVLHSSIRMSDINSCTHHASSSHGSGSPGVLLPPEDAYYLYPTGEFFKKFPNVDLDCDAIRIMIYHPGNKVSVGQKIRITGSLNYKDIPAKYINTVHTVTRADGDYYDILLVNVNIDATLDTSILGGEDIRIYSPTKFRIRFDYPDTIGKNLGFRNTGDVNSVTPYINVITNDVIYDGEDITSVVQSVTNLSIDQINTNTVPIRDALNLKGPPYILMTCKELPNLKNFGAIKDVFYKISMDGDYGSWARDSFVDTPLFFNNPLLRLSTLSLDFYNPDGVYYDFNGIDHSFVLQIITYDETPEGTGIKP